MEKMRKFLKGEKGVTAIEYAVIASIVATAIVMALTSLGLSLSGIFSSISGAMGGGH